MMTTEVKVPALGESISEATISKWFKKPGDAVAVDETIAELETDKVTMEVPAPISGVMGDIIAAEGSDVEIGALICYINGGAVASTDSQEEKPSPPPSQPSAPPPSPAAISDGDDVKKASPSAQKIMAENNINANAVTASGPKGNILKEDVQNIKEGGNTAPRPAAPSPQLQQTATPQPQYDHLADSRPVDERGEERVRMSKLRKVIATRLKQAQNNAAMLTTFNEVDMTALMATRAEYKDGFEKKHNARLGFMSFFVKAAVLALQELPSVNAEIYGDEIIYKNYYDIGIAVGSPQGLVVPVLRDADKLSFADIEAKIGDFGRRAREGKLSISEMSGGTFTITNGGVFGSLLSTPIINPPQSGILGMHKIQKRPICKGDEIVAAPMMYLAFSYDHRIIDGREAVTFLVHMKNMLEDPARLLLNV